MEILFYQGLIFITLVLVRLFAPKYLEVACLVWTALTLVNLFWPPLIVLQLLVVWGTYAAIRPKESSDSTNKTTLSPNPSRDRPPDRPALGDASKCPASMADVAMERRLKVLQVTKERKAEETAKRTLNEKVSGQERNRSLTAAATKRILHQEANGLERKDVQEIRAEVERRGIPHLVHFTRCENLASILRHGLLSVTDCHAQGIQAVRNDMMRLDGKPEGTSLSITFPNYKMFYKYRQFDPAADWVVLLLSVRILWEKECGFFKNNAADARIRMLSREKLETVQALRDLFESTDAPRQKWLRPYDPTDPQAEIMVYNVIEPNLIETVAFERKDVAEKWKRVVGGVDTIYAGRGKGLFGSRAQIRGN